jgi:hypothetical protein
MSPGDQKPKTYGLTGPLLTGEDQHTILKP